MTSFDENENNFFKKWKKINEKTLPNFLPSSSLGLSSSSASSASSSSSSSSSSGSSSTSNGTSHKTKFDQNIRQELPYASFLPASITNKLRFKSNDSITSDGGSGVTDDSPTQETNTSNNTNNTNSSTKNYHYKKIEQLLAAENVDLTALRKQSWNGVPKEFRCMVWQLLLGYLPTNKSRREQTIARKRKEYVDTIPTYFSNHDEDRTTQESEILRQILVDLPRTCPNIPFFQQNSIQKAMERILYIWSIRHPASGYVQGMNDLLTPILLVFMNNSVMMVNESMSGSGSGSGNGSGSGRGNSSVSNGNSDVLQCDLTSFDETIIMNVEADSYWCLTKLLDNIQDHYTFSQPGLQRMVCRLEDLIRRIDNELHDHFQSQGVEYMQFAFRWMNCLLLRELPLPAILRLWDTYLSEERKGFDNFHVYVCVVILKIFSEQLQTMQFQDILLFLQDLPTSTWGEEEMESILAQAYILNHLFEESPNHLT